MFVPLTPIRCLYRAVDLFGSKTGVVSGDRSFTYREFGDRCERLTAALKSHGIAAGDRVAFLSLNNHQLLEAYYGVPMAGAILMPLNVRLSAAELAEILNHSGARWLFYEPDFAALVESMRVQCPALEWFVLIGDEYERTLEAAAPERIDFMGIDENSPAELFYTSGSTGTPKGVVLTHRTLYLHAMSAAILYEKPESMVDLHTIPLFHANGWGHPQASTMLGTKQVMVRRFEPLAVLELIQHHRATDMCLVPTMANALINAPEIGKFDLSSLRKIMIGGAASSPELIERVERAFDCKCTAGYGLTETAPVLTTARDKGTLSFATESERYSRQAMTGWAVPGVELRVVDGHGNNVPPDLRTVGEIVARGDHVMEGYFRDEAGTAAVIRDSWFYTGDMAVWDAEGYIQIVDRKKEIIISGGENISSVEVEKAISAHPEVYECAVVAAPDDKWGEIPVAIVVRKSSSGLTAEELCEFLQCRIAKFKMPRKIEFSTEPLPKTGTGKIRKLALRERFWEGKIRRVQG